MKNPTGVIFITSVDGVRVFANFYEAAREVSRIYANIGSEQTRKFYPRYFVGERYDWRPTTYQVRDETYLSIPKWKLKELLLQDGRFYFRYDRGVEVCVEYWTYTRYHRGSQRSRRRSRCRSHHKSPRYVGLLKDRERFLVDCEDYDLKKPRKTHTEHWLDYEGYYGEKSVKNWKRYRKNQYRS